MQCTLCLAKLQLFQDSSLFLKNKSFLSATADLPIKSVNRAIHKILLVSNGYLQGRTAVEDTKKLWGFFP